MNIVVGISGASGVIYGIKLIENLNSLNINVHLIMSKFGEKNIEIETDYSINQIKNSVFKYYDNNDLAASLASGSLKIDGKIIITCSIKIYVTIIIHSSLKTVASVSNGFCDTLISRACDVAIKEKRPLILSPRETPLNAIHLENLLKLSRMGVSIIPPMPAMYIKPKSINELIEQHTMKILDHLGLDNNLGKRWSISC